MMCAERTAGLLGDHGQHCPAIAGLQSKKQRASILYVLRRTRFSRGFEGSSRRMTRPTYELQSFRQADHSRAVDRCFVHPEFPNECCGLIDERSCRDGTRGAAGHLSLDIKYPACTRFSRNKPFGPGWCHGHQVRSCNTSRLDGVAVRFRVGCELSFEFAQQTPLIAILNVNCSCEADLKLLGHLVSTAAKMPAMRTLASAKHLEMADRAAALGAVHLASILEEVRSLRAIASERFSEIDVIMTPCCAAMPWEADVSHPETIDGRPVGPRGHAIYAGWVNAIGHPAISVPAVPAGNGMPIGVQLVGDLGSEEVLIGLAAEIERVQPWVHRVPAIVSRDHRET
jgi:hypothetical protein